MFKKTLIAGLITGAFASAAMAADAPTPEHTLTGNVGVYSQYIFRGLTQTNRAPALQGGADYSHSSGFYAGTWASQITWLTDSTSTTGYSRGKVETDLYGGYKGSLGGDVGYDVGLLQYYYPGTYKRVAPLNKADTLEAYAALSWKFLSAKYSQSITNNTFGVSNSSGSYYLDVTATVPVTDSVNLIAHWGNQKFQGTSGAVSGYSNDSQASYQDYKLGVTYALPKDFSIGAYYTTTDIKSYARKSFYTNSSDSFMLGKEAYTVYVSKTF